MEDSAAAHLSLKAWAEDDRPREKMLTKGRAALSDAELIAILIGSGSRNETAVELAQRILRASENNLHELGKRSLAELMKFKGVGEAKAIAIAAALELGRRRQRTSPTERPVIRGSHDSWQALAPHLTDLAHEEFWLLFLNRANAVLGCERLSAGGITGTVVDSRLIFRRALEIGAVGLVVAHNHPSGNLTPSAQDISLTKKLVEAGKTLEINVLDHLILSERGFYSFADEGKI